MSSIARAKGDPKRSSDARRDLASADRRDRTGSAIAAIELPYSRHSRVPALGQERSLVTGSLPAPQLGKLRSVSP